MTAIFVLMGITLFVSGAVVILNRQRQPDYKSIEVLDPPRTLPIAGPELHILTWNIGYGALGADADSFTDGGKSVRALSKQQIIKAAQAIAKWLVETHCDIMCLQEVSQPSVTTRNADVRGHIDHALSNYQCHFWADIKTVWLPHVLRIRHGMATYSDKQSDHCEVINLPDAETHMLGFIKKSYVGLLNRFPIGGSNASWVVINIHLPIFNMTAAARVAHLTRVFEVAKQEYEDGNLVIIGGDWNTRLCATTFPHQTDDCKLTDFTDFPQNSLPAGWKICADPKTPTVRALDLKYEKGRSYTTVFDGFVASPNVRMASLDTYDLGFAHSDHQPVVARFFSAL